MKFESTKAAPYVYIGTHKETEEFYIGVRWANVKKNRVSSNDLGVEYFTSGAKTKKEFDNFKWVIVAEFIDSEVGHIDAYKFEQELIFEHWDNPKILNKHHQHGSEQWKQIDHKFSEKILNEISDFQKALWASLTEEEKRKRKEKELESKRNRSAIRQEEVYKKASESRKKMHRDRSPKQKAESKAKESATWAAKTEEEIEKLSAKIKQSLAERTEEEKDIWKKKLRIAATKQNENMTETQKNESIRKQLETKANKTDEEKAAYSQKLKDVAAKRTPEQKAQAIAKGLETKANKSKEEKELTKEKQRNAVRKERKKEDPEAALRARKAGWETRRLNKLKKDSL